jgi:hypothetical protein
VLSDSSDEDKAATANQPSGGDAAASSSRDLEEEEHRVCLEAERATRRPEAEAPHGKGPAGETSAPSPLASAIPGKRGWVERDAS